MARLRQRRLDDPEWRARQLAGVNARRLRFVGRNLAITAKKRAKDFGFEYSLTPEWLQGLWDSHPHCGYCGRELCPASGKPADNSPSLDRIDSNGGYTEANTILACFRCNTVKRDATVEELEALAANIRRVLTHGPRTG